MYNQPFLYHLDIQSGQRLPTGFEVRDTYPGGLRYQSEDETELLCYIKGVCSNHHHPTDINRTAVGTYTIGPNDINEFSDIYHPTSERAVLQATLGALDRRLYKEGYSLIVLISHDQYLIDGLTTYYEKWEAEGWRLPNGQERPNQDYWHAIVNLCGEHGINGVGIGLCQVSKQYFDSLGFI